MKPLEELPKMQMLKVFGGGDDEQAAFKAAIELLKEQAARESENVQVLSS